MSLTGRILSLEAEVPGSSFVVQTELMQKLHQRLKAEGITINYPMRTLQFPNEWGPEVMQAMSGVRSSSRVNGRASLRRGRRRRLTRRVHVPHDDGNPGAERSGPSPV